MSKQLYQRSFQLAHYMVIKYTDQATLYNLATSLAAVHFSTQMSTWALVTWVDFACTRGTNAPTTARGILYKA